MPRKTHIPAKQKRRRPIPKVDAAKILSHQRKLNRERQARFQAARRSKPKPTIEK